MKRLAYISVILIGLVFCISRSNGFTNANKTDTTSPTKSISAETLSYTFGDTLEPDEIPNFVTGISHDRLSDAVPLRADAPVDLKAVTSGVNGGNNSPTENKNPQNVDLAVRIHPPALKYTDLILPEIASEYALVQYTAEKSNPRIHNHSPNRNRNRDKEQTEVAAAPTGDVLDKAPLKVAANAKPVKTVNEVPDQLLQSIQTALTLNTTRTVTTVNNTPGDILLAALPYGADSKIWQPDPNAPPARNSRNKPVQQGNYIYSIGTLCWNYVCNGKTLLRSDGKNVYAKVGAGYQLRPGSFLALLAMSNIMPNYELKVGGGIYTIGNLIASEKRSVSRGSNMSLILLGLSFYGTPTDSWKNDLGETWNIERMVIEELNRPIDQGTSDVTDWLLGLTAAVNLYEEEKIQLPNAVALAKKQIGVYQEWVLSVQNEDYLWHPKFFLYRGVGADNFDSLYSSGHILRWLVLSLPDERLQDLRIKRSINSLITALNRIPTAQNANTLTDRQLESLAIALQTISIYKQRVYGEDQENKN
ncbi:MAG: hypothetical protein LBJ00_14805 [Planctomycetaceae bacterium]|jgi:hypothetical protein|nr:hypothetical protein [Planctomycetaceae bacterium]